MKQFGLGRKDLQHIATLDGIEVLLTRGWLHAGFVYIILAKRSSQRKDFGMLGFRDMVKHPSKAENLESIDFFDNCLEHIVEVKSKYGVSQTLPYPGACMEADVLQGNARLAIKFAA